MVAAGDRGYVFTVSYAIEETETNLAPIEATFKRILAGTELTPATARP